MDNFKINNQPESKDIASSFSTESDQTRWYSNKNTTSSQIPVFSQSPERNPKILLHAKGKGIPIWFYFIFLLTFFLFIAVTTLLFTTFFKVNTNMQLPGFVNILQKATPTISLEETPVPTSPPILSVPIATSSSIEVPVIPASTSSHLATTSSYPAGYMLLTFLR